MKQIIFMIQGGLESENTNFSLKIKAWKRFIFEGLVCLTIVAILGSL